MKAGWPVTLPSNDYSPTPKLGLDGTLYVLTDTSGGATKIHALGSDGKELPGWPADSGIPPNGQNRSLSYLVAADGTIRTWGYDNDTGGICVNAKHTVLNAIGTDGRVMPGWPRQVDGLGIEPVLDSQGTLYLAYGQPEGSSTRLRVTVVNEDGTTGSEWPASLEVVEGCPELQYRLALGPTGTIYVLGTAPTGDMVTAVDQRDRRLALPACHAQPVLEHSGLAALCAAVRLGRHPLRGHRRQARRGTHNGGGAGRFRQCAGPLGDAAAAGRRFCDGRPDARPRRLHLRLTSRGERQPGSDAVGADDLRARAGPAAAGWVGPRIRRPYSTPTPVSAAVPACSRSEAALIWERLTRHSPKWLMTRRSARERAVTSIMGTYFGSGESM
jgi:hypothetical protein